MFYENKISAQVKKEIIHLNESHQLKRGYWWKSQGPCPKSYQLLSDISYQQFIKNWTSDRLVEVQGANKVTVQGKE